MEVTQEDIKAIIGTIASFSVFFALSGWLMYSFYYKPEILEKKKRPEQ